MLKTAKTDTAKVKLYYQMAMRYVFNNPDSCQLYGEKILAIGLKNDNQWAQGVGHLIIGDAYFSRSELTLTLEHYLAALNILEQIKPQPKELGTLYGQIISAYVEMTDYKSGEEYAEKCINVYKTQKNNKGLVGAYNNIGDLYDKEKKYDIALAYYQKALKIAKDDENLFSLAIASFNIGSVYRRQGKQKEAFSYITEALALSRRIDDTEGIIYNYTELGHLYFSKQDFNTAIIYTDSAIMGTQSYDNMQLLKDAYMLKSNIFEKKGQFDSTYFYFKKSTALKDSLYNEFSQKLVYSLTTNQKIHSLQQEALTNEQILSKQIQANQFLAIVGLILFGALLFLFLLNRQKVKHNQLLQDKNTQIESQKEALAKLNADKDKLISIISHDLRSPINQLKSILNLLNDKIISQNDFLKIIQKFNNQVDTLSENLENILSWAAAQMKGKAVQKEQLNVESYVKQISQLYEPALAQKDIAMNIEIPTDLQIHIDKEHLNIALRNIIGNAIKFSHQASSINVSAGEKTEHIFIRVSDKGVGMSDEQLENLFNSHKTMSSIGTLKEVGTGIGLKLSKEFIEKSGGSLEVYSEVGKGSTFTILMPK